MTVSADDEARSWELLGSTSAHAGYVSVRRDRYRLPDGGESDWDVIDNGDTVVVVAVTPDERAVIFDQYRVGPRRVLGDLPGGLIDDGEDAATAGARELLEETGYRGVALFDAGAEWTAANASRRAHVVVAAGCVRVAEPAWGEHESGRVRTIPIDGLVDHLLGGELSDAGGALRGLHVFARAAEVEPAMRGLQARVREALVAGAETAATRDGAVDPLAAFWDGADESDPERLWTELDDLLAAIGADAAVVAYERASLHDYLGEEAAAIPLYRDALAAGLGGARRAECTIQLASSLRNVGDASGALALLHPFPADDPLADAARAFEALALFSDAKPAPALRTALLALVPHLPAYRRSLAAYARELTAPPRVRAVAVAVVVRDGYVLAEEYDGGGRHTPFLRAPGGGIEFGETAAAAMRRELREELEAEIDELRLLGVVENIFDAEGRRGHEIVHVFAVRSASLERLPRQERLAVLDSDTTVGWYAIDELRSGSPAFYPDGILDLAAAVDAERV